MTMVDNIIILLLKFRRGLWNKRRNMVYLRWIVNEKILFNRVVQKCLRTLEFTKIKILFTLDKEGEYDTIGDI